MRDTFVRTLIELAEKNRNIELLTGDLGFGVLKPYWESLPDQFTNMGIAEQNMAAVAAGMAAEGKTVFMYSIGNFPTLRCLEQIRNDCAYHKANVKIVCVGGGLVYGSLGMSHHATEDMAILRALPDVTVLAPGDAAEAEAATRAMAEWPGTCYLRLGRGGEKRIHDSLPDFQIGKAICVRDTQDCTKCYISSGEKTEKSICKKSDENLNMNPCVAVFSTGAILGEVSDACDAVEKNGIKVCQYSFPTVKPIDAETMLNCASRVKAIYTVEEHNIVGGFGSAVAEVLAEPGCGVKLHRLGLKDQYCSKVGTQDYLRGEYGISKEKIAEYILKSVN